jgi:hypothetical protein
MSVALDHLVVAAASLGQGVAWCEDVLGITPGPGGRHAAFGTHNRLFKIAGATFPRAYCEIIAIDPEGRSERRRWFALDDPAMQARLAEGPRLVHFVARSTMLDAHRRGLIGAGLQPGDPVRASRDAPGGRLEWEILVRDDGALQCGGALPTLIQWRGVHPTDTMPDSGVVLKSLALRGLGPRVRDVLRLRGVQLAADAGPALAAVLGTPKGDVTLQSTAS